MAKAELDGDGDPSSGLRRRYAQLISPVGKGAPGVHFTASLLVELAKHRLEVFLAPQKKLKPKHTSWEPQPCCGATHNQLQEYKGNGGVPGFLLEFVREFQGPCPSQMDHRQIVINPGPRRKGCLFLRVWANSGQVNSACK